MENGSHVKRETYKQAHNNRGGGGEKKRNSEAALAKFGCAKSL